MTLPRFAVYVSMETVDLPVQPPIEPMLAKAQAKVPDEPGVWSYEPKWDGFRALVFRDGDEVVLQSRSGKDLGRYFPELLDALRDELAPRCVLDGEVVVPREIDGRVRLDWESLSQRIHPAESRVKMLSEQTPAHFIGFDALATGDTSLLKEPFRVRRAGAVPTPSHEKQWCHVTRTTEDPELGAQWLDTFEGAGLDGVIAKRLDGPYLPGKREMVKVKHARDADCVAIGYRIHKSGEGVGSILLGLYRDDGELQMIGGAASFTVKDRHQAARRPRTAARGRRGPRRRAEPVELRGRQALDPGAPGEGRRGGLRPDGGQHGARPTVPARREVRALAARPGPAQLHLRAARRAAELRSLRRTGVLKWQRLQKNSTSTGSRSG